MEIGRSNKILLSPAFLCGLFLLVLNDFYLKANFHNDLTGKLSDFARLFVFPLFFASIFPKRVLGIYVSTVFGFMFWKSPLSQGLIDLFNQLAPFRIGRTVDFTDLIALSVIPVSYFYILKRSGSDEGGKTGVIRKLALTSVIFASVFAFTATSYEEDRTVHFEKKYAFTGGSERLIAQMRRLDKIRRVQFRRESEVYTNLGVNIPTDPEVYDLDFEIREKFCDSYDLEVSLDVVKRGSELELNLGFIRFWCKTPPTEQTKEQLLHLFEKEVAEKLQLKPLEKKAANESTNQTSSPRP